jgi:hypothetical protein
MTDKSTVTAIDQAINAAKARKAAKAGRAPTEPKAPKAPKAPREPKAPRVSDEEKAARKAARAAELATKKAARVEARAAKAAEKAASKSPAHMSKVARAAERLPSLGDSAQLQFNDITANFSRDQVNALALHLAHFNRARATERALSQKLTAGMSVRIVGGDSRYVGQVGTVAKAQRIRCYVHLDGVKRDQYCFTSDVEVLAPAAAAATA